ncbi:MAG: cytochrome c oxidase assembly protein [Actinomycetota bacterium]
MTDLAATEASPWAFHFHPDVWLLVIVLAAGYATLLHRLGPKHVGPGTRPATTKQQLFYFSGLVALWAGADWPVHDLSESYLFSVHMVQHMLFTFVAPPLLLLGLPAWLLRALLPPAALRVVRVLTRPLVALLVFNGVIAITHWPTLVDASLRSEPLHFVIHFILVTTATFMWWPVVSPLPETARLSEPAKMLYLFLQSVLPTVPASFLTFADRPIYRFYQSVPRVWEALDVVTDQRVAGLIMKLGGGLLLWGVIAVLFFRWNAHEEGQRSQEQISWEDFERELEAWDLRRS